MNMLMTMVGTAHLVPNPGGRNALWGLEYEELQVLQ